METAQDNAALVKRTAIDKEPAPPATDPGVGASAGPQFVPSTKREIMISPARMQLAEYARADWVVTAEEGTTLDDLQNPAFFAHMSNQLKPYDHIEVRIDDNTYLAGLIVLEVARNWARVKILYAHKLVDDDHRIAGASQSHSVEFKGPHHKWSVIRLSDGEKLKTGCQSRAEADAWMRDHEKVS